MRLESEVLLHLSAFTRECRAVNPSLNFKFVPIVFAVGKGFKQFICLSWASVTLQCVISEHTDAVMCVTPSPAQPGRRVSPEDAGWQLWQPSAGRGTPVLPTGRGCGGVTRTDTVISSEHATSLFGVAVMARKFRGAQGKKRWNK